MNIVGEYTYNKKALKHSAFIELDNDKHQITLHVNDEVKTYLYQDIHLSKPLGTLPDSIYFSDGGCFTCDKEQHLRNKLVLKKGKLHFGVIHFLERYKMASLYLLACIIPMVYLFFQFFLPSMASIIAKEAPVRIQMHLGQETLVLLNESVLEPSKLPLKKQQELKALFERITPQEFNNYDLKPRLIFRDYPKQANALTLTDGTIIITDELVNLIEDENELVSVLLHEMGHHYHHHIMNSLVSSSSLKFVSMWILRKSSGIEDILLNSGNQLMTLSYSRDMELEADQFAIEYMLKQERPLEMMESIFIKLANISPEMKSKLLSTHPLWKERLNAIDASKPYSQDKKH